MANKGMLLVTMQPPPALEEEFNAWYDTEHIPDRCAVPGFESGIRFICVSGGPRYLALYDLASASVMESPEYLRVAFDNSTPWTKRVTSRVRIYRAAGEQIYPGTLLTGPASRILLLRFRALDARAGNTIVAAMRENFEGRPETRQVRVITNPTPAGTDYLGIVEARAPLGEQFDLRPFGTAADALDLVSTYTPY